MDSFWNGFEKRAGSLGFQKILRSRALSARGAKYTLRQGVRNQKKGLRIDNATLSKIRKAKESAEKSQRKGGYKALGK